MDTFLFDLDGTLLPMNQDKFIDLYFKGLSAKLAPDFEPKTLIEAIWEGTRAMIGNDGTIYNNERFWDTIIRILGDKVLELEPIFTISIRMSFRV